MDIQLKDWECDVCGIKARIPLDTEEPKHNCRPRGLGDVVAKGLKKVGITKDRVSRVKQVLTGNDHAECGCKGRQGWLNSLWSFADDPSDDSTDIEMPYYSLERMASLEREAIATDKYIWTRPDDDVESIIKFAFLFREEDFFGHAPKHAHLAMYDIDGIFCDDIWPDGKLTHEMYKRVLQSVKPTNAVRSSEIKLVTGRHPEFREVTIEWFNSLGMELFSLDMYDGDHDEHHLHAQFKARMYKDDPSQVFIESDPTQAYEIYRETLKTVICPASSKVYTNKVALLELQKEVGFFDEYSADG